MYRVQYQMSRLQQGERVEASMQVQYLYKLTL